MVDSTDLIIQGHGTQKATDPQTIGDSVLVAAGHRGQKVGRPSGVDPDTDAWPSTFRGATHVEKATRDTQAGPSTHRL